jgi:IclR family pca regulon transcriptional regulator
MSETESRATFVGGFQKGLRVIEAFDADRQRQSIADIARTTGLDRATCRRLLLTLVDAGYAEHDGKFFWLSPRTIRLGNAYLHSAALPNLLQQYLEQLSSTIHESCSASILEGDHIVYVARASYERVMSINLRIGSRLPIHCSSMGRVLAAAMEPETARTLLQSVERKAYTAKTMTDLDALMTELGRIREQGYALVDQELEVGLRSIAIPVLDKRNRILASINIGANAARVPLERLTTEYLDRLRDVQTELQKVV